MSTKKINAVVDRIEGTLAVLAIGSETVDWPLSALPNGITEGTPLSVVFEMGTPSHSDAESRLERLRAKGPVGDTIDL